MRIVFTPTNGRPIDIPADEGRRDSAAPKDWRCTCGGVKVHGCGKRIESFDTFVADAKCTRCGANVGVLRAKVSTLFGLEEDQRIDRAYPKIY